MGNIGGVSFNGEQIRLKGRSDQGALYSATRTLSGDVLVIATNVAAKPLGPIRLGFRFAPWDDVKRLTELGESGIPVAFSLNEGISGTCYVERGSVSWESEAYGDDAPPYAMSGSSRDWFKGTLTILRVS